MKPTTFFHSCRRALLPLLTAGVVLALAPGAKSQTAVTLTILHSFDGANGFFPAAPPVEGTDGNLYGTTQGGASSPSTIYRITPAGTLTTLHTFSAPGVIFRDSALTRGSDGNFYGTNYFGGTNGYGTVYEVTPAGALTVLVTFQGVTSFSYPNSGLVQDSSGNLYGAVALGSGSGNAVVSAVVEIPPAGGTPSFLYYIPELGGYVYQATLAQGIDGNFYGTTSVLPTAQQSASTGYGTVFRINPLGTFQTLYRFTGGADGSNPIGSLVQGQYGNIYCSTSVMSILVCSGSVSTAYEVTKGGLFTTLYTFTGEDGEGANGLTQGSDGSFYGTNTYGGAGNGGTIFKLTVTPLPAFFAGQAALGDGAYYLAFPNGDVFGYYGFLSDPHYVYHFDLGYEYVFDAQDGKAGVYLYDFKSNGFFYTSPTFPFPYLYDFSLNTVLYYYPDPNNPGHYNTDGVRYFYDFATGQIISK